MPAVLHWLQEAPESGPSGECPALAERLRDAGHEVHCFTAPQALLDAIGTQPAGVVIVGPDVSEPLATARWLARHAENIRFVFLVNAVDEPVFRQQSSYAAPPGNRWTAVPADADDLVARVEEQVGRAQQQRTLHSTLLRMKLQLPEPRVPDSAEYRRLVASDRYLASVLRHAHDAIVSVDRNGRIVSWNKGAEQLFGLTLQQAQRHPLAQLFHDPEAAGSALAAALTGSFRMAGLELEQNGARRHVDGNFGPLQDDEELVVGAVAILRDITERHQAEEALRASSRQKDEFLAMLAHELRNPLAPIRNATQVLGMLSQADPRALRATQIIARQTGHMAGLIDDLLDVARVTRGAVVLKRTTVAVADVVTDAVEQARSQIDAKSQRLGVRQDIEGLHVLGDHKRLTQVLTNLLVNAAKYTPERGAITVHLGGDARQVVVTVSDTGVGMSAELVSRVFDLFVQAKRSPDRSEGGLGIGLALVRSLVAMHGGAVSAFSAGPGKGSRFEVRLPRAWPSRSGADPAQDGTGRGQALPLNLMVVDDSEDAAHSLGVLLQANGHRVDVAIDPRVALSRATEQLPDVLILDIGMPHIDGYELARRIRSIPTAKRPVLIALTGYGHASDRERAELAGFDHHFVKPLEPGKLLDLLEAISKTQNA